MIFANIILILVYFVYKMGHLLKFFCCFNFDTFIYFTQFLTGLFGFFLITLLIHFGTFLSYVLKIFLSFVFRCYLLISLFIGIAFKFLCCQFVSIFLCRSWDLFPVFKSLPHSEIINKLTRIFFWNFMVLLVHLHIFRLPGIHLLQDMREKSILFPRNVGQQYQ